MVATFVCTPPRRLLLMLTLVVDMGRSTMENTPLAQPTTAPVRAGLPGLLLLLRLTPLFALVLYCAEYIRAMIGQ